MRLAFISSASSVSHSSTLSVVVTGSSGTTSPRLETIATICVFESLNCTLLMPWKSFLRCDWITAGFFAWPRISSRSSSPMK